MTIADFFQRLHGAFLVLAGRVALPEVPPSQLEVAMAFDAVKAKIGQLEDALTRAATQKASDESALTQANSDKSDLQSQLTDAENQILELLQPAVDQAEALAPPPPPPPAPAV